MGHVLGQDFFERDATLVAPELLNKVLVVGECRVRITETEAYRHDDPASHSCRGQTKRNAVMFGPSGCLYVYFTYGMHHCMNVTTGPHEQPQAVLLRAAVPLAGVDQIRQRRTRNRNPGMRPLIDSELLNGPGKLCQALGIDLTLNGTNLCVLSGASQTAPQLLIVDDGTTPPTLPTVTARIGISQGTDRLWRWVTN